MWESRRLFLFPGSGWPDVIDRLRGELEDGLGSAELVELAENLSRLPMFARLYASACMFNLVISDTEDFRSLNGVLHIRYNSNERLFWLHHIGFDDQQECLACPEDVALEQLCGLIEEKFMVCC